MESFSQQISQVRLIFETGSVDVNIHQFSSENPIKTLIVDKYFSFTDYELPTPYHQNIIGFLYPEDTVQNPYTSYFYYTLSTFKVIYRAFEESPEHVIYILCEETNSMSKFLLISFSFYELFTLNVYLATFASFKSEEMCQLSCFNAWVENYKQALTQWITFSENQKSEIVEIVKKVKDCKEKQANLKQRKGNLMFGDCLLCCDGPRCVVFLPCGHIVGCLNCTVKRMKIELNRKINRKRSPKLCPLCKGVIVRALEVIN